MTRAGLAWRSLRWYRRTHLAVLLGIATAVAVLAGALVVGDSVRASLRELALGRLGRVEAAVRAGHFFGEELASRLSGDGAAAPLVALEGALADDSGRRAFKVAIYGVDRRFFSLQHVPDPFGDGAAREAMLSPALAAELGAVKGASLLLRIEAPSEVPGSSLFGERDQLGRTLRVSLKDVLPARAMGEFALRATQQDVRAAFVPLRLLQRTLKQEGRANLVVLASAGAAELRERLRSAATLEDLGLRLRVLEPARALSLESASALLDDGVAEAARAVAARQGLAAEAMLTYLANAMRAGEREIPYSLVTGLDAAGWTRARDAGRSAAAVPDPILLNDWAAEDLRARPGDALELSYYVWEESGRLRTDTARFTVAGIVPLAAGDRDMTPDYPGITESVRLSDWNPPFPVELKKIRPRDEEYWQRHRGTPKAFLPLPRAQQLWRHRLGALTALRLPLPSGDVQAARPAFERELLRGLDPERRGFEVISARAEALAASRGSTDFDEYFLYFSFFLIASALLLAGLFFRLGMEQRLQEIGLLRALGWSAGALRRQFLLEALALAALGGGPGVLLAVGFAALVLEALTRFGFDAVGTRALSLHLTARAVLIGAPAGIAVATLTIGLSLRGLMRLAPRPLLQGAREDVSLRAAERRRSWIGGGAALVAAFALAAAAAAGGLDPVAGFFSSAFVSLVALLAFARALLRGRRRGGVDDIVALGLRSASQRPGRSLLSIALIACATFVIVAVGAFRHGPGESGEDKTSGTGGYSLVGESLLPIHYDPGTPEGREQLNLGGPEGRLLDGVRFTRLRLRPGDDASCLNLYRPQSPRILGAPREFLREGRFRFAAALATSEAQKRNPWLLLEEAPQDGALPAIADQNSIEYVLHSKLGGAVEIDTPGAGRVRLRLVGALQASLFQSELIVAEPQFLRLFPGEAGYRVFLLEAPRAASAAVAALLESRLSDAGLDLQPAQERLLRYLRVENTYIATFQLLGAFGLLLGTLGLATVILRNAAERRRELSLLRAVGFRPRHLGRLVLSENAALLLAGLGIGAACALLATWPAARLRGGSPPLAELGTLLLAVLLTGLLVSRLAVRAIVKGEVLEGLRND